MTQLLKQFFTPPNFYNEDNARIAFMLTVSIVVIGMVAVIRTVYSIFTESEVAAAFVFNGLFLALLAFTYWLMRIGYVWRASFLLTVSQWTLIALAVAFLGGVTSPSYGVFIFVIFVAGLLLGGRWAIGYAVMSIGYGFLMLFLEQRGILLSSEGGDQLSFITITPSFVTTAVLVYLYDRSIINALHRARTNEQKMSEHAAELKQANEQLAQEITQRKHLQSQLLQSQKLEAIGRLSGGIAHDLNNLLVPILGYVELSLLRLPEDEKLKRNLENVKEGAERAAGLTKQILAFSRQQVLTIAPIDPVQTIYSFEKMVRRLIGENIHVSTDLDNCDRLILADKSQFEQVLLNLVVNARDAMPNGGRLTISLQNTYIDNSYPEVQEQQIAAGHYVTLAVSDTGHGMDAETQHKIFDPFFTTKEEGHGTGLGLSTVFGIIKQHQGHVWVYSEIGHGTTFKVYWPQADQGATVAETKIEPQALHGTETILVAEDDAMVRNFIYEALSTYHYNVITPNTPTEVVEIVAHSTEQVDLVLTDVIMPSLNGRQLHQKIAEHNPDIKVLYMSGYTDDIIAHHGLLEPELNFLSKPFSIHELAHKIRLVLDS